MSLLQELKKYDNTDYQNGKGKKPKNGIPVIIDVLDKKSIIQLTLTFKDTDEEEGRNWALNEFGQYNILHVEIDQVGDYLNEWVNVILEIENNSIEEIITPGSKGVTNKQMIPALKKYIEENKVLNIKILKEHYNDTYKSSLKYLNKKHIEKLKTMELYTS